LYFIVDPFINLIIVCTSINLQEGKYTSDEMCPSPESMPRSVERTLSDDDEEMKIRAPFIPMSDDEELSVFDPAQLFSGLDLDHLSVSL